MKLAKMERSTLEYVAQGCSNLEIATHHGTRENTENKRVRNIMRKLRAKNRTHAAVLALLLGLINPPELDDVTTSLIQTGNGSSSPRKKHLESKVPAQV